MLLIEKNILVDRFQINFAFIYLELRKILKNKIYLQYKIIYTYMNIYIYMYKKNSYVNIFLHIHVFLCITTISHIFLYINICSCKRP